VSLLFFRGLPLASPPVERVGGFAAFAPPLLFADLLPFTFFLLRCLLVPLGMGSGFWRLGPSSSVYGGRLLTLVSVSRGLAFRAIEVSLFPRRVRRILTSKSQPWAAWGGYFRSRRVLHHLFPCMVNSCP